MVVPLVGGSHSWEGKDLKVPDQVPRRLPEPSIPKNSAAGAFRPQPIGSPKTVIGHRDRGNMQATFRGRFSALFADVRGLWQQDHGKIWMRFEKCPECQPPRWPRSFGRSFSFPCQDCPDGPYRQTSTTQNHYRRWQGSVFKASVDRAGTLAENLCNRGDAEEGIIRKGCEIFNRRGYALCHDSLQKASK